MSGRLYCLASTESKSCLSSPREARVADHVARVARDHDAAGSSGSGQGQLRGEALRLHQRLVVDHDQLVPLQKTLALWRPAAAAPGRCRGRAVVGHLQLAPAQFFVKKRSSEKSEVLVTVSVLEAKSCGTSELVTSPQTLPVDTPPLVAVRLSPAEATR